MRPKKVILLVDSDEQQLSVLQFLLKTHAYKVLSASNARAAIDLYKDWAVSLAMVSFSMSGMKGVDLVAQLKGIAEHVPIMLLADPKRMGGNASRADAVLDIERTSARDLLDRIKVLTARKRGPKPFLPVTIRLREQEKARRLYA